MLIRLNDAISLGTVCHTLKWKSVETWRRKLQDAFSMQKVNAVSNVWMSSVVKIQMLFFSFSNSCTFCRWSVHYFWCFEAIYLAQNCSLLRFSFAPLHPTPLFIGVFFISWPYPISALLSSNYSTLVEWWVPLILLKSAVCVELGNNSFYLRKSDHNCFLFFSSEKVSVHCYF